VALGSQFLSYLFSPYIAEDVQRIEEKDLFDPKSVYVSLTSHAEQFGVEPVRIKVT